MSSSNHVITYSAVDNVSTALQSISNSAADSGVKLAVASGAIVDAAKSLNLAEEAATDFNQRLSGVSVSAGVTGVKVSDLAVKTFTAADRAGKLASEMGDLSAGALKAGEASASLSAKMGGFLRISADAAISVFAVTKTVKELAGALAVPFANAIAFEDAATRLSPLVGGLERSRELIEHLRKESANGTMSLEQLSSVAGRLAGTFESVENVKTWTTAFHNLSAGTGLDINELIGNFSKLRAAGRVTGEFAEMFAQKGINLFGELSAATGKTAEELRTMAGNGTLSFGEFEKAILAVSTGAGKFAGMAAEMSGTFGGSLGTLRAEWNIFLSKLAEPVAAALTPVVGAVTAAVVRLQPVISTLSSAAVSIGRTLSGVFDDIPKVLGLATTAALMFDRRFRAMSVTAIAGGIVRSVRGIAASLVSARAAAVAFGTGFSRAMATAKVAVAKTGIGLAVVLVGEAIGWLYGKFSESSAAAEDFAQSLDDLSRSAQDLSGRFNDAVKSGSLSELRKQIAEEQSAWEERLDALDKNSDQYRQLSDAFEAWKKSAADAAAVAESKIEEAKRRRRAAAQAAEIEQMRERSAKLTEEIRKSADELTREALAGSDQQIQFTLSVAKVGSLKDLEDEIRALSALNELTAEQEERSRELLDAKKQISRIEKEAESVRAGLREKVALMQAELRGNEALLALKEKLHRAELRDQFLKAGVPVERLEEYVQKYIELEQQVESARKKQSAAQAAEKDDFELSVLRAKAAGNDALVKQLERERNEREHVNELVRRGVELEEARLRARERFSLEYASEMRRNADSDALPGTRSDSFRARPIPPEPVRIPSGIGVSLLDVNVAIRDNTRGILDVLRGGFNPQKVLVNPVLS